MDDLTILRIAPEAISETLWKRVSILLDPAIERSDGRYDNKALLHEILLHKQQLWIIYTGDDDLISAMVTSVISYPLKRYLCVTFVGGEGFLNYVNEVHEELAWYAEKFQCEGIELIGRKGWERALKHLGFENKYTFLSEEF